MPQLDSLAYLSQVFWLILLFSIYYIVLVKFILPRLKTIFDVRHSLQINESRFLQNEYSGKANFSTFKFPTQNVVQLSNLLTLQILRTITSNSTLIYRSICIKSIRYLINYKRIKFISII